MTSRLDTLKKNSFDIILAFLSAILLILCFPGFGVHYLAWIALVPFFILIKRSSLSGAVFYSLITGFLFFSGILFWGFRLEGYNIFNSILQNLLTACYFCIFVIFVHHFNKKIPQLNALTFPVTWVLIEYLRTHIGFLSWPWGILGYSQYSVIPIARISAFAGVYGVSFLIIMVNTILAEIIHPFIFCSRAEGSRNMVLPVQMKPLAVFFIFALVLFSATFFYGSLSLSEKEEPSNLKVALIQGNVYKFETGDSQRKNNIFMNYLRLSSQAADSGPDLIAWPSSSVPGIIPYERGYTRRLSITAKNMGKFLLVGSSGQNKLNNSMNNTNNYANSAFLFAPDGNIAGRYDKIRLLPFDEYLPLKDFIRWPSWIVSSEMNDARRGEKMTIFRMNGKRFGTLICWESLFPEQFRKTAIQGVDFMVSMTNESFTEIPAAHYQMLAMNVFRAIENNVSTIRTSTTGVSCIIGPDGRIISKVRDSNMNDVNVEGYIVGQMPLTSNRAFYNRHGDWFVYTLFILFIALFMISLAQKPFNRKMTNGN